MMRRIPWRPLIVAVGVAMLMLGARRAGLRDRQHSGREGHELFDGGGRDALAASHHEVHVLHPRHRDDQNGPVKRSPLMRRTLWLPLIVAAGVVVLTLGACTGSGAWTTAFMVEPDELASTGRNPYFILEPGYSLVLEGGNARLTITVLNEVKKIDGVETRVVEERET